MGYRNIIILLLINIVLINAIFNNKPSINSIEHTVFSQLFKIQEDNYGSNIMSTIQLELQNGDIREISKVIKEIKDEIEQEQIKSQREQEQTDRECKEEEDRLNSIISHHTDISTDASLQINLLNSDISILSSQIKPTQSSISLLTNRISSLQINRSNNQLAYQNNYTQTQSVLQALDLIIEKVSELNVEGQQLSDYSALLELGRIGEQNPILSLVQIASTFNLDDLNRVNDKLNTLREQIILEQKDEQDKEENEIKEYDNIINELNSSIHQLNVLLTSLNNSLNQKSSSLIFHNQRLSSAQDILDSTQLLLNNKIQYCSSVSDMYIAQSNNRKKQIEIIEEVENIVATKLEIVKEYFNDRNQQ